jgi:ubiquinone/menaquinone biosynthesis C-methylase UbiE
MPEAELMNQPAQAQAYAEADFSEPHDRFVELFRERFGNRLGDTVLDLGCGPGDICRRFARCFPDCTLHAIDASMPMLALGHKADLAAGLEQRIDYFNAYLPNVVLPEANYSTIISNSLLHHLKSPDTLWKTIQRFAVSDTRIFIMDLLRPASTEAAEQLVAEYSGGEPQVLKKDFYNSLLAAYSQEEIESQLAVRGLDKLSIEVISDRHFIVWGSL